MGEDAAEEGEGVRQRETPAEHLLRIVEEAQHREIARLDRRQRIHEAKEVAKAPFRWLHDVMTGM